jgi:hypothetical protein
MCDIFKMYNAIVNDLIQVPFVVRFNRAWLMLFLTPPSQLYKISLINVVVLCMDYGDALILRIVFPTTQFEFSMVI